MKKHALIITASILALSLAGCTENGKTTTTATEAPAASAPADTTSETSAPEATVSEETTSSAAEPVLPDERLFGGYLTGDSDVDLMSSPDENGTVLVKIPCATQIEVYASDKDGWYMTKFDGKIGYLKADSVAEIPAYDMDNYIPDVKDIAGRWIHEKQDTSYTEEYRGIPGGCYTIYEDGTYTYTTDYTTFENGTVAVTYEEHPDGSTTPWFSFTDANGNVFMGCVAVAPGERMDGCLYIGQDGSERLVPDNGNAEAGTDNYSVPNEYGFYEFKNPPASGVSIAALEGTWNNAANSADKLVVTKDSDIYKGYFEFTSGNDTVKGNIKLEFALNPDDSQTFWYTFYSEDGKLWNAFSVSGDIPLDDLYAEQSGEPHFTRAS